MLLIVLAIGTIDRIRGCNHLRNVYMDFRRPRMRNVVAINDKDNESPGGSFFLFFFFKSPILTSPSAA